MAYTVKVVRTRPTTTVDWSPPDIKNQLDANEYILDEIDREASEDGLTVTTMFHVDVLPDRLDSSDYLKMQKEYRTQNGIVRTVTVFDESGQQIDSWED